MNDVKIPEGEQPSAGTSGNKTVSSDFFAANDALEGRLQSIEARLTQMSDLLATKREIQNLIWNSPQQLSTSLPLMSEGRRKMFFLALHSVTAKGLLGRGYNHQLLQQMQDVMEVPLRV